MPDQYPEQYPYIPRQNGGKHMGRGNGHWRNDVRATEFFQQHADEMTDKDALKRIMKTLKMAKHYQEEGNKEAYLKSLDKAYNMIKSLYATIEKYK